MKVAVVQQQRLERSGRHDIGGRRRAIQQRQFPGVVTRPQMCHALRAASHFRIAGDQDDKGLSGTSLVDQDLAGAYLARLATRWKCSNSSCVHSWKNDSAARSG